MYCVQKITLPQGEVLFGLVGFNDEIHVKVISAHVNAAPERFSDIQELALERVKNSNDFVLPRSFSHRYYDDYAALVFQAAKKIDWKKAEKDLYNVNLAAIKSEMDREREAIQQHQDRLIRLQNSKDVAQDKAERGLLRQAMSYLQSVIFRIVFLDLFL